MSETLAVQVAGDRYTGRAIEIRQSIDPQLVVEASRKAGVQAAKAEIRVEAPPPPPVYEHVGYVHNEMGLQIRTALAKAARTVGGETAYDDSLTTVNKKLTALDPEPPDQEYHRRRQETKTAEARRLKEQAAMLRGQLAARREYGLETESTKAELRDVLAALSEAETTAQAARQGVDQTQQAMREYRDRQEQRFRLEDKRANLERKARASLVEQYTPEFRKHVQTVSTLVEQEPATPEAALEAIDPVIAALALIRLASFETPVVLSCSQVESAEIAAEKLDAAIIRI